MEIEDMPYSFQADSDLIRNSYENDLNYLIDYNNDAVKEYCILYFSSNNIYYPNTENEFIKSVTTSNKFEWFRTRVNVGYKHIFLRDIKKQWYLSGLNHDINNPEKLLEFLKKETEGFKVIALGSSAGGFASVIYGQLLNAEEIYSFNGQFEISSLLKSSNNIIDPLLFRHQNSSTLLRFYDSKSFITNPDRVFYFHSSKSKWDCEQKEYIGELGINTISFNTSHHGIPFLKSNLPYIINLGGEKLKKLSNRNFNPIWFSLNLVGIRKTINELTEIALKVLKSAIK